MNVRKNEKTGVKRKVFGS